MSAISGSQVRQQGLPYSSPELMANRFPVMVKPYVHPGAECDGRRGIRRQLKVELKGPLHGFHPLRVSRIDSQGPSSPAAQGLAWKGVTACGHLANDACRDRLLKPF
jgi:hypothetical protein